MQNFCLDEIKSSKMENGKWKNMGFLRILLAISVLVVHADFRGSTFYLVPADLAVEIFYIISGYYMAMILTTKYMNLTKAFFINRAIKIYSIYFIALFFAIIAKFFIDWHHHFSVFSIGHYPFLAQIWIVFSNIFLLGLDGQIFTTILNHHIIFIDNFRNYDFQFSRTMLIPQAWSISLELYFYLLIPFILKRKLTLFFLFVGSLLIKTSIFYYGFSFDPWSYRFFPAELCLFLLGVLAYQYNDVLKKIPITLIVFYFIVIVICPGKTKDNYQYFLIYALTFLIIPSLFSISKNSKLDRIIGDTSYPFYLIHGTILEAFSSKKIILFSKLFLIILITFIAAFFIEKFFYERVQRIRNTIIKYFKKTPIETVNSLDLPWNFQTKLNQR